MGQETLKKNSNTVVRHAYVKNGDVIKQLDAIGINPVKVPTGGPNAFLAEFLFNAGTQPLLLISNSTRNAHYHRNNIDAWVFCNRTSRLHPFGTAAVRVFAFFKILFHLFKFKPDRILCGTLGFPLWACFIYARMFSVPIVHSLHNRIDYADLPWYKRPATQLDKWILKHVDRAICHGPFLRQQLLDAGVSNETITEFDCGFRDMWEQLENQHGIVDSTEQKKYKTITFLGRMEYSKGIADLLQACTSRLAEDNFLRLVYAGDGPDAVALKKKVIDLDMQRQVLFLGLLSHDKLADIIRQSYVLVTPTRSEFPEGRCMATMEGLAMKVPVIAPDFGPFPYLVQHKINGLLFTPDSVPDLCGKINLLLDDAELYARLCDGAQESSNKLLDPPVTFYKAVQWAFRNGAEV